MSTRIYVVDDYRDSADVLVEILQDRGYDARAFGSGEGALAALRQEPPDLLVTDVRMDGLDGMGLLRAALTVDPDLPVLLVTAYPNIDIAVEATRAGAFAFVTKPVDPPQLLVQVRNALDLRTLRRAVAGQGDDGPILGSAPGLLQALGRADRAATTDLTVLLQGDSGTGKELFARRIHQRSPRASGAFVPVNCGAIPDGLVESELFGSARGSYTGADRDRPGLIEAARGGTLFLDEVGELSAAAQVRLLRFLQEGTVRRVGENRERKVDVRVIAATHRDLREGFREDLYYRLSVIPIQLPPLRERGDDVLLLLGHALRRACAALDRPVPTLSGEAVAALRRYGWPGNVRELRNLADRVAVLSPGDTIDLQDLPREIAGCKAPAPDLPQGDFDLNGLLEDLEARALRQALRRHHGVKAHAAASLGLQRAAFLYKLKKYGIE